MMICKLQHCNTSQHHNHSWPLQDICSHHNALFVSPLFACRLHCRVGRRLAFHVHISMDRWNDGCGAVSRCVRALCVCALCIIYFCQIRREVCDERKARRGRGHISFLGFCAAAAAHNTTHSTTCVLDVVIQRHVDFDREGRCFIRGHSRRDS